MRWPPQFRSLLAQFTLRVIAPLTLVMLVIIAAGLYVYQQAVTALVLDRDRQLAALSAAQLTEAMTRYARELEALASSPEVHSSVALPQAISLENSAEVLQIFTAGIVVVDRDGTVISVTPAETSPVGETVAGQDYFISAQEQLAPTFSQVMTDVRSGQYMIVIATPILDDRNAFVGALLGAVDLKNTTLSEPIEKLHIGDGGLAYLVDGTGHVISHPDVANIGADFADRPFVANVIAGESGGTLWQARTTGEEVVLGYAPVANTGWGLIVREPWDSIVGSVQTYGLLMVLLTVAAVGVAAYLLWQGVRRIAVPIQLLVGQTARLAAGEIVESIPVYGIDEMDMLEHAFNQMATQIASYRAGLRRYVEVMTQAQEEEGRRIARELHDETVQSLLTIARRLELYQISETAPARLAQLAELQKMVTDTMLGVRQISRDLRPLILEDLGLIPALRALARVAPEASGERPQARLEIDGQPIDLGAEQELALYRVTQEALANVHRHARATNIWVALTFDSTAVRLEISDDGLGFEVPRSLTELAQGDSFGLMGIQERVWVLGGSLVIKSAPGQGTRLSVTLPLQNGRG